MSDCPTIDYSGQYAAVLHGGPAPARLVLAQAVQHYAAECRHKFALPIGEWNVSGIKDFHDLFSHRGDFDEPLHGWDMSSALDTQRMFYNATPFNQDLSSWDVSSLVYANQMFALARSFNQYLYSWNVGRVEEMTRMFQGAASFRRHLVGWDRPPWSAWTACLTAPPRSASVPRSGM